MKKTGQDSNEELIAGMTRRSLTPAEDKAAGPKHIVYFTLRKTLNLVGPGEVDMEVS